MLNSKLEKYIINKMTLDQIAKVMLLRGNDKQKQEQEQEIMNYIKTGVFILDKSNN